MKRTLMTLMTAGMVLTAGTATASVDISETLSAYPLKTFDGSTASLSSYKGDVVVLNFWASWCAPCRKELPVMNRWHESWTGNGARVVAVSIDKDLRKAMRFVDDNQLTLNFMHDKPSGLARMLDLPSLPCTYLLDRNGHVAMVIEGSNERDLDRLFTKVETMLKTARTGVQQAGAIDGGTP